MLTDATAVTRATLCAFVPRARAARVSLILQIDPAAPLVSAGPDPMAAMVEALIANALAATGFGGQVTVAAQRGRNGGCLVSVSDTGTGMAGPEAAAALTGKDGGLSQVRHMANLYDARLALHSTPGVGTVVTVSFPPAA
jgi:signal transduction histidine kinase